jgi:hypothetical protein
MRRLTILLAIAGAVAVAAAASAQTSAEQKACKADFEKYCAGVVPGGGRVIACLQKQMSKLSPDCQKVVQTYAK